MPWMLLVDSDTTWKGLDDLRNGIIRTPLPPLETFLDDPLRVIRCVRFASRFGFEMDHDLQQAAQLERIQVVLAQKISRERVGEEIDKMMKGLCQPSCAEEASYGLLIVLQGQILSARCV
jgi:tRNA nucleotidyltransferase/poly(A) polymerase